MPEPHACPHCGNTDKTLMSPYMEPTSQIAEEAQAQRAVGKKWYCEQCAKTWIVQALPFEGPNAR